MGKAINILKGTFFSATFLYSGYVDYNLINNFINEYHELPEGAGVLYYSLVGLTTFVLLFSAFKSCRNFTKQSDLENKLKSI